MQIRTLNDANPALRRHPEWRSTQLRTAARIVRGQRRRKIKIPRARP
jgi:hypothetical protein